MAERKITQKQGKALLITRLVQFQIIVVLLLLPGGTGLCSVSDERIQLSPVFPETQQQVKITCNTVKDRVWYHNGNYMTTCNKERCFPSKDQSQRYVYTADQIKTEVTISFLNRTLDSGVWTCDGMCKNNITLDVYSFPPGLTLHEIGKTEGDLAVSQVTLKCQTDGCTYPVPNITWYYKDVTKLVSPTYYKETGTQETGKDGVCISPENIYTSLLTLPLHTTWLDNSYKSVTFSCGIDYNSSRKIFSTESQKIRFAEDENPDDHQYASIPVLVGMGAGIAILVITVVALVIIMLRKRSRGNKSKENEVSRYEGVRLDPTGGDNAVTREYDSIRQDAYIYTEIPDNSADSVQINMRLEPGLLIHQSVENDVTCNVYDSGTSSKPNVYSYVEPLEIRDQRKEKSIYRSGVRGINSPVPRTNAPFNSKEVSRNSKVEVHSYLELQGLD